MSTETAAPQTQAPALSSEPPTKSTGIAATLKQEKEKFLELERVIERNYRGFLEVGRALLTIRDERLYRCAGFDRWEDYIVQRWAISRSRGDELCPAVVVAHTLLLGTGAPNGESPLPESIPEVVLRPLSRLSPELQGPVWKLASLVSPETTPTQHTTAKLVRLIEGAISEGYGKKNGQTPAKPKPELPRERVFCGAITRLSKIDYIPEIICLNIANKAQAEKFAASCQEVSEYCQAVRRELDRRFSLNLFAGIEFSNPSLPNAAISQPNL